MQSKFISKNILAASIFVTLAYLGVSCKKSNSSSAPATIAAQVSAGSDFTSLYAAVTKAGLATTLSGAGPFTVFAPTDSAFNASGITPGVINSLTSAELQTILLYHTLPSKVLSSNVPAGPNAKVVTASGDSVFVTNNANGVFVNGIKVTHADIAASNGVIHTLGRVLLPPVGNIVGVASSDTLFSFLVAAVVRASSGSTNVAAVLSGGGILTVFAPTNNAFRAAGFPDIAAINAADPNTLTSILTYHVIAGRIFSSDLTQGAQPQTVNGGKLTVSLSSGATVKGNSNTSASNIIGANIMATNGVVHVIDQVLLP
jgi:uncharacterized surface protein with fasciclin (FAS1) repeats